MGRAIKVTRESVLRRICEGYGSGHGAAYKPWLEIRRGISSPFSNQSLEVLPDRTYRATCFSRHEAKLTQLLYWLGAEDVRTQFPLWPMPHVNPLAELSDRDLNTPDTPGLLEIASDAGIPHGVFVGTSIPYVATIDLMVTHRLPDGCPSLAGISVKPREVLAAAPMGSRILERLELERRYALCTDIHYCIADGHVVSKELEKNMNTFSPRLQEREWVESIPGLRERSLDFLLAQRAHYSKRELEKAGASALRCSLELFRRATRLHIWSGPLDTDLSQAILLDRPLPDGAEKVRAALSHALLGAP